jgi:hypothetical protein
MAGLVVVALLAGGGIALGANLASPSGRAQASLRLVSSSFVSGGLSGTSRQHDLAGLRTCLATARRLAHPGHHAAARAKRRACVREYHARGLLLLRRLLRVGGEHGQITFKTKKGSRTVAFERGLVQDASSSSVVVKAADGTAMTWNLTSKTVIVRVKDRAKTRASASALAAGQRVFLVGAVVGGADNARLIIIRG